MFLVVLQLLHGEVALLAGEPPRTRVDHLVDIEVGLVEEGLAAEVTGELVGAGLVRGEELLRREGQAAVDAADHLLRLCWLPMTDMVLVRRQLCECLTASRAAESNIAPFAPPPPCPGDHAVLLGQVVLPHLCMLGLNVVIQALDACECAAAVLACDVLCVQLQPLHSGRVLGLHVLEQTLVANEGA